MTLLEVVIATSVVAIGLAGISVLSGQMLQMLKESRLSGAASQLLQQRSEQVRSSSWADVSSSNGVRARVLNVKMESENELGAAGSLKERLTVSEFPPPASGSAKSFTVSRMGGIVTVSQSGSISSNAAKVDFYIQWNDRSHKATKYQSRTLTTVMVKNGVTAVGLDNRSAPPVGSLPSTAATPGVSATPTPTSSPTPASTATPTPTPVATPTPTPVSTPSATPSPSASPAATPNVCAKHGKVNHNCGS